MKQLFIFLFGLLFLVSCSSAKSTAKSGKKNTYNEKKSKAVVDEAKTFLGTKYQLAGTDKKGIDCSGLVVLSYQKASVYLPRKAKEQAAFGFPISINEINSGDLLFFKTSGLEISHVGIVERIESGQVFFIHSSTTKGVIISSMNEVYWKSKFVSARRILTE